MFCSTVIPTIGRPTLSRAVWSVLDQAFTAVGSSAIVVQIRAGGRSSTTDWSALAERDRWGHEKALSEPGAFARLRASANSSYFTAVSAAPISPWLVWNMQRKRMFVAASRAASGMAFAGLHMLSPGFWLGIRTKVKRESVVARITGNTFDG